MMTSKTKQLLLAVLAALCLATPVLAGGISCHIGEIEVDGLCVAPSPEQAVALLQAGNTNYRNGDLGHLQSYVGLAARDELLAGQHPYAIILTCSDSRVPPEVLFDKGLGEVFPIRVAGNVVAGHELGSIEYAVEHLHAPLIVVLGHERCGAVGAAYGAHGTDYMAELGPNLGSLVGSIDPAVSAVVGEGGIATDPLEQAAQIEECVIENAKLVAESLESSSPVIEEAVALGHVKIVQAKYDLDTGVVSFFTGLCGDANEQDLLDPPASLDLCTNGTASSLSRTLTGWSWACAGSHGGGDASCSASIVVKPIADLTVPANNTTGTYLASWKTSATTGVTYKLYENDVEIYSGLSNSFNITNRSNATYSYTVKAIKAGYIDSEITGPDTTTVARACANITTFSVPATNSTGTYLLSWSKSSTAGVTYKLYENDVLIYSGLSNSFNITNRSNATYSYKVKATRAGFADSAINGPVTTTVTRVCGNIATFSAPSATSITGRYLLSWSRSSTAGVTYKLYENGVLVYSGLSNSFNITGRGNGVYQYTIKATRAGFADSSIKGPVTVTVNR